MRVPPLDLSESSEEWCLRGVVVETPRDCLCLDNIRSIGDSGKQLGLLICGVLETNLLIPSPLSPNATLPAASLSGELAHSRDPKGVPACASPSPRTDDPLEADSLDCGGRYRYFSGTGVC